MNAEAKQEVIDAQGIPHRLPEEPEIADLLPFVRLNIKRRRLRKKFMKGGALRYSKRIPDYIRNEFLGKILSKPFFLFSTLMSRVGPTKEWDTEEFARRAFKVEPIGQS